MFVFFPESHTCILFIAMVTNKHGVGKGRHIYHCMYLHNTHTLGCWFTHTHCVTIGKWGAFLWWRPSLTQETFAPSSTSSSSSPLPLPRCVERALKVIERSRCSACAYWSFPSSLHPTCSSELALLWLRGSSTYQGN